MDQARRWWRAWKWWGVLKLGLNVGAGYIFVWMALRAVHWVWGGSPFLIGPESAGSFMIPVLVGTIVQERTRDRFAEIQDSLTRPTEAPAGE